MKKIILLSLILVLAISNTKAQMKMTPDGNFSVATTPSPNAYTKFGLLFSSSNYYNMGGSYYNYAFSTSNTPPSSSSTIRSYGLNVTSCPSTQSNYILSWGISGYAGNGLNGWNFGVMGSFGPFGSNGAGVYGINHNSC